MSSTAMAAIAYLYARGRLPTLRKGVSSNTSSSESESESEDYGKFNDANNLQPQPFSNTTNPISARPTSLTTNRTDQKPRQRDSTVGPVGRSSLDASHSHNRVAETGSKMCRQQLSETMAKSKGLLRDGKTSIYNCAPTRQDTGKLNRGKKQFHHNHLNQGPKDFRRHLLSQTKETRASLKPCALCSSLVPCHVSDSRGNELIYHRETIELDCSLIYDTFHSLLLKNVKLFGAELSICSECMMSFSAPSELLRHLYTHALVKSTSPVNRSSASTTMRVRYEFINTCATNFDHSSQAVMIQRPSTTQLDLPEYKDPSKVDSQANESSMQLSEHEGDDSDSSKMPDTRQLPTYKCPTQVDSGPYKSSTPLPGYDEVNSESSKMHDTTQLYGHEENESHVRLPKDTTTLAEKYGVLSSDDEYHESDPIMAKYNEIKHQPIVKKAGVKVVCQFCGLLFSSSSIRAHIRAVHEKLRPHKCPLCDQRFAQKGQVKQHMGVHNPFCCKICNKSITNEFAYKRHMKAHELNVKPFKCDQCDKSFMTRYYLKAHQILHTGQNPFCCSFCGKGYMQKQRLEFHMRSHLGIKRHRCPKCFKEFPSTLHLDTHMKKSHRHPILCDLCGKSFAITGKLRRHMRQVHSKEWFAPASNNQCS